MHRAGLPAWLFYTLVLSTAVNLVQAALTPLDPDEAYYWLYAQNLDWGYFDHPPAVALSIRFGTLLLDGTLGLRLGTVLLNIGLLYLCWVLAGRPQDAKQGLLLPLLLLAMPFTQIYGFVATPDAPLLFFTALYFILYQRAVSRQALLDYVLLGICMAALLYSKYHGVLVIFFVLLSHLRLLRQPLFYLAGIVGFLLFLPHLYWQYVHDFPSFSYHLKGRNLPYKLEHTLTFLLNQALIAGPLLVYHHYHALRQWQPSSHLHRAFRMVIYGFVLFFLVSTIKGHAEPQWTALLSIPLAIILWQWAQASTARHTQQLWRLALLSIGLLLVLRILFISQASLGNLNAQFQHQWVADLQKEAKGRPVVFQNSYRNAALYSFYSGQRAYSFNDLGARRNQFDVWDDEQALHDQRVLLAANANLDCPRCRELRLHRRHFQLLEADSLQVAQKLSLRATLPASALVRGASHALTVSGYNPYPHPIALQGGASPAQLCLLFFREGSLVWQDSLSLPPSSTAPARDSLRLSTSFTLPDTLAAGAYEVYLGVRNPPLPAVLRSPAVGVQVE